MNGDNPMPSTTSALNPPAFEAERSFVIGIFGDGLYSVNGKVCKSTQALLGAVKAECGIIAKPRSKAKQPGGK